MKTFAGFLVAREGLNALIVSMSKPRIEIATESEARGRQRKRAGLGSEIDSKASAYGYASARASEHRALLSPEELAAYLAVPLATVYRWRSRREGPCGIRVGRHVRYRLDDVERWLNDRRDERP